MPDDQRHMSAEEFHGLTTGDIIRHRHDAHGFVVHANYGTHVVISRSLLVSNPSEWLLISKHQGDKTP